MAQPPLGRIQPYRGCCPPPYSIILLRARGSQEPGVCWQQDPGWRGTCADGSLIADKAEAAVEIAAIVLSTLRVPLLSIQSRGNICDTIQREKKKKNCTEQAGIARSLRRWDTKGYEDLQYLG